MNETAHVFGDHQHLVGVAHTLAEPSSDTAVIMLTAGMLHHIGPHRLYVQLGRELSRVGTMSFRFDLSGIGESFAIGSQGDSMHRSASEVREAMDLVQENYGVRKFVLFGLCSGADDAFFTAQQDDRVVGAILLDGCGFRTLGFHVRRLWQHYLVRMAMPSKWQNLFRKWTARWKGNSGMYEDAAGTLSLADDIREFPNRVAATRQLNRILDRGVDLRFIYTGGVAHYFNHRNQFESMFGLNSDPHLGGHPFESKCGEVTCSYHPQMDHVATLCEHRKLLVHEVVQWVHDGRGVKHRV